ncbi:MAG: type II toxin-antitoxin system RelE/ParE family toxin [Rhodospirillaceae bacterium]|nr:type II toxin-antitoxin system RelE/ParE family toxin [Rhodospirillales bacterium]
MNGKRITIVETSVFTRRVEKLLNAEEREALVDYLAANPEAGDVMEDLGGIRKVRFAAKGKGKSGGARVIYFYHSDATPLYALTIYAKNEKADLSGDDRKAMRAVVEAIKASWKSRR